MISFISGKVEYAGENFVIVENNGLGYEVGVSNNTLVKCRVGESIKLYTYMQVKEDGISLFGFLTEEEKKHVSPIDRDFRYRSEGGFGAFIGDEGR